LSPAQDKAPVQRATGAIARCEIQAHWPSSTFTWHYSTLHAARLWATSRKL